MMNDVAALAGMLPYDTIGLYEQPKPRFIFKMPRVVPDQKSKFESDELFRRLSRESEVRYTGYRDRPQEQRQVHFQHYCREGHTEIAFVASGTNLQLVFNANQGPYTQERECDFDKEHGKYKCQYCDRRFSEFGSRIKHERTLTGERPYKCEICGKAFAYSHVLNSHNLIHTGEKKYSCPTCGKRFTKSHHLKAHLNTHEKTKGNKSAKPMPEPRYYIDVMKVITPSIRSNTNTATDDDEIHVQMQDGDIIQSDSLAILEADDIDIKEGISMIFEDGTIVQSH